MSQPTPPRDWSSLTRDLRVEVNAHLAAHVRAATSRLRDVDPALEPVADEVDRWVAGGGKRLRPLLVCLGHDIAGRDPTDVLGAATAVELVHTWALVHDDVIDASATRRGSATTHERFATRHRDAGWAGDAAEWGRAMAILVGDFVAVVADDALTGCDVDPAHLATGRAAWSRLRREVMAGQVLDVTVAASGETSVQRALRVAMLKSGRYTVTRPLELGAVLAGADDDLVAVLRRAGDDLGVAFQLRDDLLGLFGEPTETGKPVGDDLREGKRTVVIAEALARMTPDLAARLEAVLGDRDASDLAVREVLDQVRASGAVAATTNRLDELLDRARQTIGDLPDRPARTALQALADHVGSRHH